jgi:multiple sugar transport system permease protein
MKSNKLAKVIIIVIVVIFLLIELFPIFWIFLNSFKGYQDIAFYPPKFIFEPTLDNYISPNELTPGAFRKAGFVKAIMNSAIISFSSVFIAVIVGSMAAFAIARLKMGGNGMLLVVISARMLPAIVLLLPLYLIYTRLNLLDTYVSLIITYTTFLLSFVIWQMVSFLKGIPMEIEESAIVDGCNLWQRYYRIIMPLAAPGLAAVGIFSFLGAWNEYLYASILTVKDITTAPVAASQFVLDKMIPWGGLSAAASITLLPAFIFILIVQKQMVAGLTLGSVKG